MRRLIGQRVSSVVLGDVLRWNHPGVGCHRSRVKSTAALVKDSGDTMDSAAMVVMTNEGEHEHHDGSGCRR